MNRSELQQLAKDRIRDAKTLLEGGRWSAAYYLAGYAVECALKACIAKLMRPEEFPDKQLAERCWTHDLDRLVAVAGLRDLRDMANRSDPDLLASWDVVKDWNEASR